MPEEFFNLASPAAGQTGEVEKVVTASHWGLDRNAKVKILQHNARTREGNSGGPLINNKGEVVGIVTSGGSDSVKNPHISFGSCISVAKDFLKEKNIKFYEGATKTSETKDANDYTFSPVSSSYVKIFNKDGASIDACVVEGGFILSGYDKDFNGTNYVFYKLGNNVFIKTVQLVAKDEKAKLALFKLTDVSLQPLEFAKTGIFEKGTYDIARVQMQAKTILSDLGVSSLEQASAKLQNGVALTDSVRKHLVIDKTNCSVVRKVSSNGVEFFVINGNYPSGAAIIDRNNVVQGLIVGAISDNETVAVSSKVISKFLQDNGAIVDVNADAMSSLYLGDYLKIFLIVLFCALLSAIIFMVSRRRSNAVNSQYLTNLADVVVPEVQEAVNEQYTPKKLLEYGVADLKAKPSSIERTIRQINRVLENPTKSDDVNVYQVAREYQTLQKVAITRLNRCLTLVNINKKREALQMASAYPSLIAIVNSLQFENLEAWTNHCVRVGAPVPERILNSDIDRLNELITEMKNAPEDHTQILRKYMASNDFEKAIELLEIDITLNPNDSSLQRQLMAVKNNYLDKEISVISRFAQKGEHKEAVALFDKMSPTIPDQLKENSQRWGKMYAYIRSVKLDFAKDVLADAIADLEYMNSSHWSKIYDILSLVNSTIEEFPELKANVNQELLDEKKTVADVAKAEAIKRKEFEDACSGLVSTAKALKELFARGKVSRDILVQKLIIAERAWKNATAFGLEIPEDIKTLFNKSVIFVRREIKRIDKNRKIALGCIASVLILCVCATSYKMYMLKLKGDALRDFTVLNENYNNYTASTLEDILNKLRKQHNQYLEINEFKSVIDSIEHHLAAERKLEERFAEFEKLCDAPITKDANKSSTVLETERKIQDDFAYLNDRLPKVFEQGLQQAKGRFDVSLEEYKVFVKNYANTKRKEFLDDIDKEFSATTKFYQKGEWNEQLENKIENHIRDFKDTAYPYSESFAESDLANISEKQTKLAEMKEAIRKLDKLTNEMSASTSLDSYIKISNEIKKLCDSTGILDSDIFKKTNGISEKVLSMQANCKRFYVNKSPVFKDLLRGVKSYSETERFSKILNSNPQIFRMLDALCSKDAMNIYSYKRYVYDVSSPDPASVSGIYTIGRVESKEKSWQKMLDEKTINLIVEYIDTVDFAGRPIKKKVVYYTDNTGLKIDKKIYPRGTKITQGTVSDHKEIEYKYFSTNDINDSSRKSKSERVDVLSCLTPRGEMDISIGVKFEDETKTIESDFVGKIRDLSIKDKKTLNSDVCFLDIVSEIILTKEINQNFKIYVLGTMLESFDKYMPFESGFYFSPSAVELNKAIQNGNKKLLTIKSWLGNGTFEIAQKSIDETLTTSAIAATIRKVLRQTGRQERTQKNRNKIPESTALLKNKLADIENKKISFIDEARLCAACVRDMQLPEMLILAVADSQGKYVLPEISNDFVFVALDKDSNVVVVEKSKIANVKVLPFSPIVKMRKPDAFVVNVAFKEAIVSPEVIKSISNYIFKTGK